METQVQKVWIEKYKDGSSEAREDILAVEEPLEIKLLINVTGKPQLENISVTMRTPGNDLELAVGFLFTEGFISGICDVDLSRSRAIEGANSVVIALPENFKGDLSKIKRSFFTTSSCGVCGKESIESIKTVCRFAAASASYHIHPDIILSLPGKLRAAQQVFSDTGGIHASGLFTLNGGLVLLSEDVGRHNALDKLIGAALINNEALPLDNYILLLSGRASFELIQKAAMAGIRTVFAVGAPSSLAVQTAGQFGMLLIGFLKENRFNVYCGKMENLST